MASVSAKGSASARPVPRGADGAGQPSVTGPSSIHPLSPRSTNVSFWFKLKWEEDVAAYLIGDVNVTDAAAFEEYRQKVPATEEEVWRTLSGRGGATKVLEGDWEPHRLVILEFPDMDSLMAWYELPEYAPLKAIRERSATTRVIALEGIASVT